VRLGLSYLCLTEHKDFDPQDLCFGHFHYEKYSRDVAACQQRFNPRLKLLKGVEVDYQRRYERQIRAFLAATEFDFVLGAVHYIDGLSIFDDLLERYDADTAYRRYFAAVREAVASGFFDAIGHLDVIKRYGVCRYGPFDPHRYAEEIDAVLRALVETGTGLEINTSGLRQPPAETFPGLEVLRRYRELGGEIITLGSDAHHLPHLGYGIEEALEMARAAGFKAITVFEERQPRWVDIQT